MAEEQNNETTEETPEEQAAEQPVRDSGPGEGAPPEPGGSPGSEQSAAAEQAAPEAAAPEPAAVSEKKKKPKHVPRSQRRQRPKPVRERPAERKPIARTPKPESERGRRQERRGVVVSSAMDKTIVVKVDTIKAHPRYKKVVRRSAKFHAHDEQNSANVGDVVRIVETRPLSKTKRWRLVQIVEAAK